jgi:hypothetical protein
MSEDAPRLAQAAIRTGHQVMETAQTLDPNQRRRTAHQPLNPTLDCYSAPKQDPVTM